MEGATGELQMLIKLRAREKSPKVGERIKACTEAEGIVTVWMQKDRPSRVLRICLWTRREMRTA